MSQRSTHCTLRPLSTRRLGDYSKGGSLERSGTSLQPCGGGGARRPRETCSASKRKARWSEAGALSAALSMRDGHTRGAAIRSGCAEVADALAWRHRFQDCFAIFAEMLDCLGRTYWDKQTSVRVRFRVIRCMVKDAA